MLVGANVPACILVHEPKGVLCDDPKAINGFEDVGHILLVVVRLYISDSFIESSLPDDNLSKASSRKQRSLFLPEEPWLLAVGVVSNDSSLHILQTYNTLNTFSTIHPLFIIHPSITIVANRYIQPTSYTKNTLAPCQQDSLALQRTPPIHIRKHTS